MLGGKTASEHLLMSVEPRIQVPTGVAKLAELLVRLSGKTPVVLRPGSALRGFDADHVTVAKGQCPPALPSERLGLALQLAGQLRLMLAVAGQTDC
jgi:hypothetical protein